MPGLLKYIEDVHFSDKMPSNHNIYIPKINSKYIAIFEENKWNVKEKNDLLHKFVSKKISILDNKCEELEEKQKVEEKIIDLYNDFINNYYADNDENKKKIYEEICLLLFNNRDKIKDHDKLLK